MTEDSLKSSNSDSESIDLENLSDSSSEPGSPRKGKQGGGGGMGNTVSTLCAVPSDGDEQKPHVYVVEKDLAGLRAWLEGEKVGLDGLDAFVSGFGQCSDGMDELTGRCVCLFWTIGLHRLAPGCRPQRRWERAASVIQRCRPFGSG